MKKISPKTAVSPFPDCFFNTIYVLFVNHLPEKDN